MKNKTAYIVLIIAGVVVNTAPRLYDFHTGQFLFSADQYSAEGMTTFFRCQALSFVLILAAQYYPVQKQVHNTAAILALSNWFDEYIDPTHIGLSEIITAIFIIAYNIYEYRRKGQP